jgi:phage shock protein A
MPTNRVEDLEATVDELEATVRGLTEELVETKERVRILETELEEERAADSGVESVDEMLTPEPGDEGSVDRSEAEQVDVEQAAAQARSEGAKDQEREGGDDSEESEVGDDIIVA